MHISSFRSLPFFAFTLAFSLVSLVGGFAGAAKAKATTKVGYVDMARALNEVHDGKEAKKQLKTDFEKKQKELDKLQKELKKKKETFDKRSAMMKPEVKAAQQEELQRNFMELQQTYVKLQRELMDREGRITQEIAAKIKKVVERVGDREAYELILNIGDTVLFHKRHLDITDDVVQEYNKKYNRN